MNIILLKDIGRRVILRKLKLFRGECFDDLPQFMIVGTRGSKVIIADCSKAGREFIVEPRDITPVTITGSFSADEVKKWVGSKGIS